jgi:TetR/AcrR family fatty acid metabolism transcriptional regulator
MLREIIEEGQRLGIFRKQLNSKVVAKLLFGALDEMATNWVLSRKNHSLTAMVEPVLDVFLNGVSNV